MDQLNQQCALDILTDMTMSDNGNKRFLSSVNAWLLNSCRLQAIVNICPVLINRDLITVAGNRHRKRIYIGTFTSSLVMRMICMLLVVVVSTE